jgi:hypothetical protein
MSTGRRGHEFQARAVFFVGFVTEIADLVHCLSIMKQPLPFSRCRQAQGREHRRIKMFAAVAEFDFQAIVECPGKDFYFLAGFELVRVFYDIGNNLHRCYFNPASSFSSKGFGKKAQNSMINVLTAVIFEGHCQFPAFPFEAAAFASKVPRYADGNACKIILKMSVSVKFSKFLPDSDQPSFWGLIRMLFDVSYQSGIHQRCHPIGFLASVTPSE